MADRVERGIPSEFLCPLTKEVLRDPVSCADGYVYERDAIERWIHCHATSPVTHEPLSDVNLRPVQPLKQRIEKHLKSLFKDIPRSDLEIEGTVAAHGAYKEMFRGTYKGEPVAVLRVKRTPLGLSAISEPLLLSSLSVSPYLVRYIGLCCDPPYDFLVMEYAPLGTLLELVRRGEAQGKPLSIQHKWHILHQVVCGMELIARERKVHCDLAAHNVLVFAYDPSVASKTVVKVSDFGLSVELEPEASSYYHSGTLPLIYMPPEVIQSLRFSEKSDVWAWGVLCYEVLSNGNVPYAPRYNANDIAVQVCEELRLPCPRGCPDVLWETVVAPCFTTLASGRPTFRELRDTLSRDVCIACCNVPPPARQPAQPPPTPTPDPHTSTPSSGCPPTLPVDVATLRATSDETMVLQAFTDHINDASMMSACCDAISRLSRSDAMRGESLDLGTAIDMIASTMRHHDNEPVVQEHACRALNHISVGSDENKALIGQAGCIDLIASAMKGHRSVAVQEHACQALANISVGSQENTARIVQAGCIDLIALAMKGHPSEAAVQRHACGALINISFGNSQNTARIVQASCIDLIASAMKGHPSEAAVQRHACGALINISFGNSQNTARIGQAGCIDLIALAMKGHPSEAAIQQGACWVLANLSHANSENTARIVQAGCIDLIASAMKDHPSEVAVQRHACGALINISFGNSQNTARIIQAGCIDLIASAMKGHPKEAAIQRLACGALIDASSGSSENTARILQAGCIDLIASAMKGHPSEADIQQNACEALINISCGSSENTARIIQAGCIDLIASAMKDHPNVADIQLNACEALFEISHGYPESVARVRACGGVELVVAAKRRYPNHPDIQQWATALHERLMA